MEPSDQQPTLGPYEAERRQRKNLEAGPLQKLVFLLPSFTSLKLGQETRECRQDIQEMMPCFSERLAESCCSKHQYLAHSPENFAPGAARHAAFCCDPGCSRGPSRLEADGSGQLFFPNPTESNPQKSIQQDGLKGCSISV